MLSSELQSGDGRTFSLRETNPADMLDLIEAGGAAASIGTWMRYALLISSVSAIDGVPVPLPVTKMAIRELGRRIGNTGMEALARAHYPEEPIGSDDVSAEDDTAKN